MTDGRLIRKNVLWSVLLQIVTIISGFIIPRLLLKAFGSETNGLIASINQFLNYVTLLEGGVTGVATASLYKPIQHNDEQQINAILNAIQRFFLRLGLICTGITVAVAICYPRMVDTTYSHRYVFLLTLVLGGKYIIQYCLTTTFRILLRAYERVYLLSAVSMVATVAHLLIVLIAIKLMPDVLMVYFISGLTYLITPLFYIYYVHHHYSIHFSRDTQATLPQKWDAFGQNIAYFIHANTDIVLLTVFSTLSNVSVYSVYAMIAGALQGLVATVSSAVAPSIGNVLARENVEESNLAFNYYEFAVVLIAFLLYTCGVELITPFVSIYTNGITDADYIQPLFGTVLLLAEMVYCVRDPYVNVAYAANHFHQTAKYAYSEAICNIVISIVLVQRLGLLGVAVGTLVSMTIRMFQQVAYLEKKILQRATKLFLKKFMLYCLTAFVTVLITRSFVPVKMMSYYEWLKYAVLVFIITLIMFMGVNWMLYRDQVQKLLRGIVRKH